MCRINIGNNRTYGIFHARLRKDAKGMGEYKMGKHFLMLLPPSKGILAFVIPLFNFFSSAALFKETFCHYKLMSSHHHFDFQCFVSFIFSESINFA